MMLKKIKEAFGNRKQRRAWKRLFRELERYYRHHPDEVRLEMLKPMEDPQTVWKNFREVMKEEKE